MPVAAALSAAHLSAILFPDTLRRLYIARDNDPAGDGATTTLVDRARSAGIEALVLSPTLERFQRGPPAPRDRRASGGDPGADRGAGRRPLHGAGGVAGAGTRRGIVFDRTDGRGFPRAVGRGPRPRPSRGRSGGKRRGPAMAAADDFPAALSRLSIAKQNRRPSPSSAAASALRSAAGAGPPRPAPSSP